MDSNYSYPSYPDSHDSSPRSRDIDSENPSWEEPLAKTNSSNSLNNSVNYKVKFMCSYGGKIQPRPHDNQLSYFGGDTKILAVDRTIDFASISSKLSSLCSGANVCFKYQLPGEDLDALISVMNDEDLEHMMLEYDRLYRASAKPARLRLFLFPLASSAPTSFGSDEQKSDRQWFVDALNSVQIQTLESSSPPAPIPASAPNPDFLFGFDKGIPAVQPSKLPETGPTQTAPELVTKDISAGSDCGSEDRHAIGEPVVSQSEIQRQIQELQRLQIEQSQILSQRKTEETNHRAFTGGDYYSHQHSDKISQSPAQSPFPAPVQMQVPTAYLPERHITTSAYPIPAGATPTGAEQPIYIIPTGSGYYQAQSLRPVTGPVGPAYYGVPRVVPEAFRDGPVYTAPPQGSIQQPQIGGYSTEGIRMVQPRGGVSELGGYAHVGYDSAGRQVYYTTAVPGGGAGSYQTVAGQLVSEGRQGGAGGLNQEGKGAVNQVATQASGV